MPAVLSTPLRPASDADGNRDGSARSRTRAPEGSAWSRIRAMGWLGTSPGISLGQNLDTVPSSQQRRADSSRVRLSRDVTMSSTTEDVQT